MSHYLRVLSRDDTDEWDCAEMAKVDVLMDADNAVMLGMLSEETLLKSLKNDG